MDKENFKTNLRENLTSAVIIAILSVLLVAVSMLYVFELKKNKQLVVEVTQTNEEKDKLTGEFSNLLMQYEDLETNNDSLNLQIQNQQEKIKRYVQEIKSMKSANKLVLEQYKAELETLRKIMRGFIHQIDSLNTLNQTLTAENVEVKHKFKNEQSKNKELSEKFDSASNLVEKASIVKSVNIIAKALNSKGKEVTRVRKTQKFSVAFTLTENTIAKSGIRWVYVRISRPDELVLIENEQNIFQFEGQELAYSARREIDYRNKEINAVIYYDHSTSTDELIPGTYTVDLFVDGKMVGTSFLTLK